MNCQVISIRIHRLWRIAGMTQDGARTIYIYGLDVHSDNLRAMNDKKNGT